MSWSNFPNPGNGHCCPKGFGRAGTGAFGVTSPPSPASALRRSIGAPTSPPPCPTSSHELPLAPPLRLPCSSAPASPPRPSPLRCPLAHSATGALDARRPIRAGACCGVGTAARVRLAAVRPAPGTPAHARRRGGAPRTATPRAAVQRAGMYTQGVIRTAYSTGVGVAPLTASAGRRWPLTTNHWLCDGDQC